MIEEQIARIEATTQDDLESQVFTYTQVHWSRPLSAATRRLVESGRLQRRLANGLAQFWRVVLSDSWSELGSIVDQDISRRAKSVVGHGVGRALGEIHPDIGWVGDAVTLAKPWDGELDIASRKLVLVPGVLTWPDVIVQVDIPGEVVVYYPAAWIGTGRDHRKERSRRLSVPLARPCSNTWKPRDRPRNSPTGPDTVRAPSSITSAHCTARAADQPLAILADRVAEHFPRDNGGFGVLELIHALFDVGSRKEATTLISRLPATGLFGHCLGKPTHTPAGRFLFSRTSRCRPHQARREE